eukprot:m.1630927 g.1630927  ORF g.1630927 m.1630927 type:complete len:2990 (-) comp25400_c0_seq3:1249-10218(-)
MDRFVDRRVAAVFGCAVVVLWILAVTGLGTLLIHLTLVLLVPFAAVLATAYSYRKDLLESGLRRVTGGLPVQCEINGVNLCNARLVRVHVGHGRSLVVSVHQLSVGFKWVQAGRSDGDGDEHLAGSDVSSAVWWYPCGVEVVVGAIDVEICAPESTTASAGAARRNGTSTDIVSARTAVQKILVRVATLVSLRVERLRFSVRRNPYTLLVTVPDGIRFGSGDKPNERDIQTAEFRSVIQAREGTAPLNRSTRGGASGSSPSGNSGSSRTSGVKERRRGDADAEQGRRRRVRPSHLPALLEIPAINVTLLRDDTGDSTMPSATQTTNKRFCGVTATVGLAVGLDGADTLAIDVFPVYVKVDLDEIECIREFVRLWAPARSAREHAREDLGEQQQTSAAPGRHNDILSAMPKATTLACEGSVVELMSNRGQRSLLIVAESVYVDLDCAAAQPTTPGAVSVVDIKCRVRSVTVTGMHQSRPGQPVKALYVKSTVIDTKLQRTPDGDGADHPSPAWTPIAHSVAVATVQAELDDTAHGLLGWLAALRALRPRPSMCKTRPSPAGPAPANVAVDGGVLARLAWAPGLIDVQLSDVSVALRTRQLDGVTCVPGNAADGDEGTTASAAKMRVPCSPQSETVTVVTVDTLAINSDHSAGSAHRVCNVEITDVDVKLRDCVVFSEGVNPTRSDGADGVSTTASPVPVSPPAAEFRAAHAPPPRGCTSETPGQPTSPFVPRQLARASLTRGTLDIKLHRHTSGTSRIPSATQGRLGMTAVLVKPVSRVSLECRRVVDHIWSRLRSFGSDLAASDTPAPRQGTPWYSGMVAQLQVQAVDGSVGIWDTAASDIVHGTANSIEIAVSELVLGAPSNSSAGSVKPPTPHGPQSDATAARQHHCKVTCAVTQAGLYVRGQSATASGPAVSGDGDGPAVKISSVDLTVDRFRCTGAAATVPRFHDDVTVSVPQVESCFDIHRIFTLIEVATTAKARFPGAQDTDSARTAEAAHVTRSARRHVHCTLGVARCLFTAPPTKTHRPCAPPCDPLETCPAVDYVLKVSTVAVDAGGGDDGPALRVSCAAVTTLADTVEAMGCRGLSVALQHGEHPDLTALRRKCARHSTHSAAPERFRVSSNDDDDDEDAAASYDRPDASTAWWFRDVHSATTTLLAIAIDRARVLYPHGFNFGRHVEHVQNAFFGIRRRYRDASGYVAPKEKPLVLPNLRIRLKSFTFEIEDDPFEARLLLGYRLREEERDAQTQRGMVLEQRLARLQSEALANGNVLDPQWIQRARETLERENARIYCTRYNAIRPKCTKSILFAVACTDLEMALLNDVRLTSNEAVLQTMQAVDVAATFPSPMPEPTFSVAWRTNIDVAALHVSVRRFPCNLIDGKHVCFAGIVMLQGHVPTDDKFRSLRRTVDVGDGLVSVERDGMPMHVYHSLRMCADHLGYAWGACYDAAIQQSMLRLDLLMNRGVVTSPSMGVAMPWFDKLRQLRHGPIEIESKQVTLTLMAETDPNVNSNFIEFRLTDVIAAWHNSLLEVASGVDIVLFPKSRFYGCPLLSITSLQSTITLEWEAEGGSGYRTQHYTSELDKFKSSSVSILFALQRTSPVGHCACVLYAGTMVWIARVYNDLFSVGRPRIKRGPMWQHFRPPRTNTLGQHIAATQLCLNLRSASLLYYNDFDRKYGVTISAGDVLYVTTYNQEIVEKETSVADDGLRLRGTCREWQYEFEKLELTAVTAHCSNRGTPGGMSRQFRSTKSSGSGDDATKGAAGDGAPVPGEDSDDDDNDDDEAQGIDFEHLVTEIGVLLAEEHAGLDADGVMTIEEVTTLDDNGNAAVVRSHLFEATLVRYNRFGHGTDPRLRRRSSAMSPRSPHAPSPPAPDPKGRSSQEEEDNCVHKVFLKDFNLIYTVFTADILWAVNEAYAEHNALAFELSADVIATPDAGDERESKLGTILSNSTSGRRSYIGRDSDLLNMLVQDAGSNLASTNSLPAESKSSHTADGAGLERLFQDAINMFMQIRFSRPQIFFRGPDKGAPLIQVSESVQLDLRHHKLVEVAGRVNCKDSWTFNFANMQYFSAADVPQHRHVWVPYECIEFQRGGVREDMPPNFHCLAPASELVYVSIFHYFDKNIAKTHDPLMLRRRKRRVDFEKVDKDLGQDFYVYETDCLNLTVTAKEWEGISDVLTNVIFVGGDAALEQQHEIETLRFKNTITDQEDESKGAAEIEKTIKYISRLQHAVQDFQRAHNHLERLLVSMHREDVGNGIMGTSTVDTAVRHQLRDHLHGDLVRTQRMFNRVRANLRTRVLALNEYLLNPTVGKDNTRVWNARYEVKFDDLFLTFVTDGGQKICRTTVRQLEYVWNWHNTGFGEQLLVCHDMEVADCWPSAAPDKHGTASRASVGSDDGATPTMQTPHGNIVERFHGAATGAAPRGPDRTAVRVYVRDGKIVGGIPVTELLEVNLVPLNINIRQTVVDAITEFLFPKDTPEPAGVVGPGASDDVADRTRRRSSRASQRPPSAVSSVSSVDDAPPDATPTLRGRAGSAPPAPPGRRPRRHSLSSADDGRAIAAAARRHTGSTGGAALPTMGIPPSRSASSVIDENGVGTDEDEEGMPSVFPSSSCESMSLSDAPVPPPRRHRGESATVSCNPAPSIVPSTSSTAPVAATRRRQTTVTSTDASLALDAVAKGRLGSERRDLRRHVLHRRSASGNIDMKTLTGGTAPAGRGPNGALSGSMTSLHLLAMSLDAGPGGPDCPKPHRPTHRRALSLHVPAATGASSTGPSASMSMSSRAQSSDTSEGGDPESDILLMVDAAAHTKPSPEIRRRNSIRKLVDRSKATSKQQHTQAAQVAAMKRRSARHRTYICLKVPSVTVCVTYRRKDGDKSSVIDLKDVVLTLPLLEYHNRTCTFETMLNNIKADCTSSVLHAVLKTKVLGSSVGRTAKRAQAIDALAGSAHKETLLFGSDKKVAKLEKKHEKALKKLEKEEKKARKKTEKSVAKTNRAPME